MLINKNTKLLVIAPHPDDEALGCGGLIGKCKKEKGRVYIFYISVGKSRQLVTGSTRESTRLDEIEKVKKFAVVETGVLYIGNEFCRLDNVPQKEIIEKIEDKIEIFKPTIIAIPTGTSYNQDHRAVFDASIAALRPVPQKIRHFVSNVLEYFEPYLWNVREIKSPNMFLNLNQKFRGGNLLDFKINLYKCHKSQVRIEPFARSPENLIRLAYIYGKEIGMEIAEAYHVLRSEIC